MAGIPLTTIVAAELVAAAVLLATDLPVAGALVLVVLAAAVAVALVLPVGGLRIGTWLSVLAGYAARRRVLGPPSGPDPGPDASLAPVSLPAEVRALLPGIAATDQVTRAAGRLGLLRWNGTWSCVVAVRPVDTDVLQLAPVADLPVDRILAALAAADLPLDAVTVVSQTVVGDADRLGGGGLATVAGELARGSLVRGRSTWITVRIDPVAAGPAIAARGGGAEGLGGLAAAAVSRIVSEVTRAGLVGEPLGAEAAGRAMAAALLQPPVGDGPPPRWIESLGGIASAQVHHRCFAVTSWPARPSRWDLSSATGYGLTVGHEVRGLGGGPVDVRTVLRLSALTASQLDRASTRLRRAARAAGIGVRGLPAQQAAGLRLTIPAGQR